MSNVRRVYVEKKPDFAVKAKELKHEIKHYLGITTVEAVRVLIRYDVENISEETYKKALYTVFSEPPVDDIYEETFDYGDARAFTVEFLPGQFDQRADSAEQCVKLLNENEEPIIRSAITYVIEGAITDEQFAAIKKHCINPVDSRAIGMEKPKTLVQEFDDPADVIIFDGFKDMAEDKLKELYLSLNLAMTFKDFLHIQNYFKNEEKRDPSMTEIRVLDTYWSDHCRHTTFSTELKNVKFDDGFYRTPIENTYKDYLNTFSNIYKDRNDKFAGGFIIQLMPFTPDEVVDRLEKKITEIDSVTQMLDRGLTPEQILEEILGDFGLEITDTTETRFHCDCSKERVSRALSTLSKKDLDSIIADGESIEVKCQFCNKAYEFTVDELKEMR